ncbi:MAG TPA: ferrochelatase [Planctomicrobium sp.]|nr:ferrochelatase [Planctomicrobium sp.]
MSELDYDAVLFVSFGGPEEHDDVIPFLENVLRGRNVPRERMLEVAEHYYHFDGVSPINQQNRELIAAVKAELRSRGVTLPIYWGNRNWNPLLTDTVAQMKADGVKRAIAFVTSAISSYSGCRQYRQNIADACAAVEPDAPVIDKIRVFYNHPDFIAANVDRVRNAISQLPRESRQNVRVYFTAHSIPVSMSDSCSYVNQLGESCRLVAEELGLTTDQWQLAYQSRSGRPEDPWLEPDILDVLREIPENSAQGTVIVPIGFLSDHMEVLFDLDVEAAELCQSRGIPMQRAGTVGVHPQFVDAVTKLILERLRPGSPRPSVGNYGPSWDTCPINCCPAPTMGRRPKP